jgi:hypothetical protein
LRQRLVALAAHPYAPWIAAGLGVLLTLPSLGGGLAVDDYIHRAVLLGLIDDARDHSSVMSLFSFLPDDPVARAWIEEQGLLPWWSHPELQVAFMRPLSAATHVLDYRLWPDAFVLQHAHSLLWYAAAVLVIALVYRQVIGAGAAAGLAMALFALEDAHAMAASWLANRNALVSLTLGGLALLCHVRWSRLGGWHRYALAVAVTPVALLAGEAALGAVAYIIAWQLTLARGRWASRLAALGPYVLVIVVWRVVYSGLGYGAYGSMLYVDPGRDAGAFVLAVLERGPVLLLSLWSQLPIDAWMFLPRSLQLIATAAGIGALVLVGALLAPLLRESAQARFWALGMLGATVPVCASFPMDRLTIYGGIGAFALLAMLVRQAGWLDMEAPATPPRPARWAVAGLLVLHGVLVLGLMPARTQTSRVIGALAHGVVDAAPSGPGVADQTLIYVNGIDLMTMYLPFTRMVEGGVVPGRTVLLSSLFSGADVERVDARTLAIRPDAGFLFHAGDCLLRDRGEPFELGQRIRRAGFEAEVVELTADRRPAEVRFVFDVPLESPELRWMVFRDGELADFPIPPVGGATRIEPTHPFANVRALTGGVRMFVRR